MLKIRMQKVLYTAILILLFNAVPLYAEEVSLDEVNTEEAGNRENETVSSNKGEEPFYGLRLVDPDKKITVPDGDISFSEIQNRIVDHDTGETAATDFSPREELPRAFPAGHRDEDAIIAALSKYPGTRDQYPFGSCWAFASVASTEFGLINNHGKDSSLDLSEMQLAYGIYHTQINPVVGNSEALGGVEFQGNDKDMLDSAGDPFLAAQFLSKDYGFIDESEFPYITDKADPKFDDNGNLNIDFRKFRGKNTVHLRNWYYSEVKSDEGKKIAKEAIIQNGAIAAFYYEKSDYYYENNNAYYYDGEKEVNHSIAIVGWDDDFPATNFKPNSNPGKNGAWLIRNSWEDIDSPSFSHDTYFWISYEDKGIIEGGGSIFEADPGGETYDNDYYYDTQIHDVATLPDVTTVANIYRVPEETNEYLTEVSILIDDPTGYRVDIYTDLKDGSDPESGDHAVNATTGGELMLCGIFSIPLKEKVLLKKGSRFSVVVTSDKDYVTFEKDLSGYAGKNITCGIKRGQSFYKDDGHWIDNVDTDIDVEGGVNNWCISAHTVDTDDEVTTEEVTFKDSSGSDVILIHDLIYNTYKTTDGKDVLVYSDSDNKTLPQPKYQFSGKKQTPAKASFVVFKGVVYKYKTDYTISFKKNKNKGAATATIKWKKRSAPYSSGKKIRMTFEIIPREVTESMVSFTVKKGKIKNLKVSADGYNMKPKKKDYSYQPSSEGFKITFANNFAGTVVK